MHIKEYDHKYMYNQYNSSCLFRHRISLNSMSSSNQQQQQQQDTGEDNDSEVDFENLPIGLQLWRIAVATATSPAQLMLCVIQLNKSISWEKSIMKVV